MLPRLIFCLATMISSALIARVDTNFEEIKVHLITMEKSHPLYTQGGHSMLRLSDKKSDLVYNWGMFDPSIPHFVFKFYQGKMNYFMGVGTTNSYLRYESKHNPRLTIENEIFLTSSQKKRLIQAISKWKEPQHRFYIYHIWNKNCSTIIRDLLSEAIGPELRKKLSQPSKTTYRKLWHKTFGSWDFITFGADILLNSEADQPIEIWHEMFIPRQLQQALLSLPSFNKENHSLLGPSKIIRKAPDFPSDYVSGYQAAGILFYLLTCGLLLLVWLKKNKIFIFLNTFFLSLWAILSTSFGLTIILTTWFTNRTYFYYSVNLLVLWPIDFYLFFIIRELWGKKPLSKLSQIYLWAHAWLLWAHQILSFISTQDTSYTRWYIFPPFFIVIMLILRENNLRKKVDL